MGAFGEWGNGPIQFNSNSGVIEARGTHDASAAPASSPTLPPPPSAAAGPTTPADPAPAPAGGGVLPYGGGPNPGWGLGNGAMPRPTSTPASNNGGGYGIGGGGGRSGGGLLGSGGDAGSQSFDDGGEVDDDGDSDGTGAAQGAQAATIDPMMAIQRTLQYGRKKMGMPANLSQGPDDGTQSFDDGGEVDDQGVIPSGPQPGVTAGGNMPDPRATLSYLTGAGNVSPDIADALERKLDPQGTMNPSTRTIHAIASAPSPDAAFGLMQHYRTRYNAYAGGARAAMDQGNAGQAAAHATQAFQNVPTGYDVRFAPAPGGVAMSAKRLGPQAKPPTQSFDDGGEVDENDNDGDEGVIPTQTMTEAPDTDMDQSQPDDGQDISQPVVLQPDQFKKVIQAGYDKPLDDGFTKFLSSILSTPAAAADNPPDPNAPAQVPTPQPRPQGLGQENNVFGPLGRGDFSGAGSGIAKNIRSLFGSPGAAAPDVTQAVTDPDKTPAGQPGPTPNQQPPGGSRWQPTPSIMAQARNQPGQQTGRQESTVGKTDRMDTRQQAPQPEQPPAPQGQPRANLDQLVDKYSHLWERLHPNGQIMSEANNQQRAAFINGMISQELKTQSAMDIENNRNRGALLAQKERSAQDLLRMRLDQSNTNNTRTNDTRTNTATNREQNVNIRQRRGEIERALRADPSGDPKVALRNVATKYGTTPEAIQKLMSEPLNGGSGPQGQQRQPGQSPQGGGATQYKYYNGKVYRRGPNGEAIEVPQAQQ